MPRREYRLRVIRTEDLKWQPALYSKVPDLYVECRLGDATRTKRTRTIKRSIKPVWDESFLFSTSDDCLPLAIRVKHESKWSTNPFIGSVEIELSDLLEKCRLDPGGEAALELSMTLKEPHDMFSERITTKVTGRIILRLDVVDRTSVDGSLTSGWEGTSPVSPYVVGFDASQASSDHTSQSSNYEGLYHAVEALSTRLTIFQQFMEALNEKGARDRSRVSVSGAARVHPFLTIALKLSSALFSIALYVLQAQPKIADLVHVIVDAFAFVNDLALQDSVANLQQPIDGLLKQTIECCLFVLNYANAGPMLDFTGLEKVADFERALANFKQQIESGVVTYISVVSSRMPRKIDDFVLRQRLNPSLSTTFNRPTCLPNTRVEVCQNIIDWIFSESKQNIFWLHGVAGSGKSTVSTTIAQHFRDMSRLGAFLFFEKGKSDASSVIRTIAYSLAMLDSTFGANILTELEEDKEIITASPADQFKRLLLKPLLDAGGCCGPIVVILDALDECGTLDTRSGLLELIQKEFPKLPSVFRFLITSRRVVDVDKALSSHPNVYSVELDHTSPVSRLDVLSYLHTEMRGIVGSDVPDGWDWDEKLSLLGEAAGGLFVWASNAVSMVRNSDVPLHTIESLVSRPFSLCKFGLYELYESVLRDSRIDWESEQARNRFFRVMSLLVFSNSSVSIEQIDSTLGFRSYESSRLVLSRLWSILTCVGGSVGLFHPSLKVYFSSPECSDKPWFIESKLHGQTSPTQEEETIALMTETESVYEIIVVSEERGENEATGQSMPIEADNSSIWTTESPPGALIEQSITVPRAPSILQAIEQFIGTIVLEDISKIARDMLQRNVDIAYSIMSQVDPIQARQIERFLRSAAQKRGVFASKIFLEAIRLSSKGYVDGGGFANVHKGWYNGKSVALKVLRIIPPSTIDEIHIAFVKEALVWQKLNHPNVLPFLGICRDAFEPQMALVSHWMEKGNLYTYLKKNPSADHLKLSLGVARGLEYLHELTPQIIHGDLRAPNVLIDDSDEPRIADFGLVRVIDPQARSKATSFKSYGASRWLAPELLDATRFGSELHKVTTKSDVYAFSCVCLEIFTGEIPFFGFNDLAVLMEVAVKDERPSRPGQPATEKGLTDDVWSIMQDCWKTWPNERPDMSFVVSRLEDVMSKTQKEPSESSYTMVSESSSRHLI